MDITEIMAKPVGNADKVAEAARIYFEHLATAMLVANAEAGDADESDGDRIHDELTEFTERIHNLPANCLQAVRARVTVAYFWTKNGGHSDVDAGLALDSLAETFCGPFEAVVDPMFAAISAAADRDFEGATMRKVSLVG